MKKKFLVTLLALTLATSAMPAVNAKTLYLGNGSEYTDTEDPDEEYGDSDVDVHATELTKYDIQVSPAKKTIKKGKSFTITLKASNDSDFSYLSDEEWQELVDENVDKISFRSDSTTIASVNKKTGKVTARNKGIATIKTTVNLANGETATWRTKVYVTN